MSQKKLQDEIVKGLRTGDLLPEGVRAEILENMYQHTGSFERRFDFVVRFSFKGGDRQIVAAIEVKQRLTIENIEYEAYRSRLKPNIVSQMDEQANSPECLVLATRALPQPVRNKCKELKLAFLDLNGNFFIRNRFIYIDIATEGKKQKSQVRTKNIFQRKARRVLRVLLSMPYEPLPIKKIAEMASISVGQVSNVLRTLKEREYIEKRSQGSVLTRPRKLLMAFGDYFSYFEVARKSEGNEFYGYIDTNEKEVYSMLSRQLKENDCEIAGTLFSGLEDHEKHVSEGISAFYVSCDPCEVAANLGIPNAHVGANIILRRSDPSDNTSAGGVFYNCRILANGVRAVSLVQVYLDFVGYPGRGREQADYIMDKLLGFTEHL